MYFGDDICGSSFLRSEKEVGKEQITQIDIHLISAVFWVNSLSFMVCNLTFCCVDTAVNPVFTLVRNVDMYKLPVSPKKKKKTNKV